MEDNITVEDAEKVIGEGVTLIGVENLSNMFTGSSIYFDGVNDIIMSKNNDLKIFDTGFSAILYGNFLGNGTAYWADTEERISEDSTCAFTIWDGSKKSIGNRVISFVRAGIADNGKGPNYYVSALRLNRSIFNEHPIERDEDWGFAEMKNHVLYMDGGADTSKEQHCVFSWDGKSGKQFFYVNGIKTSEANASCYYWDAVMGRHYFF